MGRGLGGRELFAAVGRVFVSTGCGIVDFAII